ncbi:zinc finger protein 583-like isoform X2 [Ambystoma mexicanum]|uniref:zinc finger protein 583-like isoform X2 n=1 Tax=Ambystoma mexicanum TaxID=8296 RepID=UPI0037E81406
MSWAHSDEAQVTFQGASAYFSDEEWMLLHEWQKELYRNVMKEIHQALISLGPLIATTVCSLRNKEKDEIRSMITQSCDRGSNSQSDAMHDPTVLLKMNKDELDDRYFKGNEIHNSGSTEFRYFNTGNHLRKEEEPVPIFIDHLGAEVGESINDPNSEHEAISFQIKDEQEPYCMDHQESKRLESITSHTGGERMDRKSNVEVPENVPRATTRYKAASGKDNMICFKMPENEADYNIQSFPENPPELRDQTSQYESGLDNTVHFKIHYENPKLQRSEKYHEWESKRRHSNVVPGLPETLQNRRLYSCTECEKSFSRKGHLIQHRRIHTGVRPYQCNECEKSFSRKEHLMVHKRTHTGVRPYHCSMCEKSFTQMGVLIRHQRTHTQDRPYQCTECGKNFSRKGHLSIHQKTHT